MLNHVLMVCFVGWNGILKVIGEIISIENKYKYDIPQKYKIK